MGDIESTGVNKLLLILGVADTGVTDSPSSSLKHSSEIVQVYLIIYNVWYVCYYTFRLHVYGTVAYTLNIKIHLRKSG